VWFVSPRILHVREETVHESLARASPGHGVTEKESHKASIGRDCDHRHEGWVHLALIVAMRRVLRLSKIQPFNERIYSYSNRIFQSRGSSFGKLIRSRVSSHDVIHIYISLKTWRYRNCHPRTTIQPVSKDSYFLPLFFSFFSSFFLRACGSRNVQSRVHPDRRCDASQESRVNAKRTPGWLDTYARLSRCLSYSQSDELHRITIHFPRK